MTTAERRPAPPAWLREARDAGRTQFRSAGALLTAGTAAGVLQWTGVALLVAAADGSRAEAGTALPLVVAGGVGGVLLRGAAAGAADRGGREVQIALRRTVTERILPGRTMPRVPAARAADAVLDLPASIARSAARLTPLHIAVPGSMSIVLVVVGIAWWPVAVILAAATLLMPLNLRVAGLAAADGADEHLAASATLSALVLDTVRGGRELGMLGALERRRRRVEEESARADAATMRLLQRAFLSGALTDALVTLAIAVAATASGLALLHYLPPGLLPPVDLPRALLVLTLCPLYFAPLRLLGAAYHDRATATAAISELAGLPDNAGPTPVDDLDAPVREAVGIEVADLRIALGDGVTLRAAGLSAPSGSWTAVTGASGSGKTTLLGVLAGLLPCTSGSAEWRQGSSARAPAPSAVGWLGQRTVLLDATLAENVRLGDPSADDASVDDAVRRAGLGPLVDALPLGARTVIGPSGRPLSHGEARRVAIARALLRDAPVWILDEPDAHLDPETADAVLGALADTSDGRTVIAATHSPAVEARADQIWRIAEDRRVEAHRWR